MTKGLLAVYSTCRASLPPGFPPSSAVRLRLLLLEMLFNLSYSNGLRQLDCTVSTPSQAFGC